MFKVQVLNAIAAVGLNELPKQLYDVSEDVQNPDALLVRSASLHDKVIPQSVIAIGRAGAGVDNIPVLEMTKRGIPVFNTPGANANAVCELVFAGMLIASRNLFKAWDYLQHLECAETDLNKIIEQNKKQFAGFELAGKTLGIIGLGSIGVKVANVAIALGMNVIGYDPTITVNRAWELSSHVKQARDLHDLLSSSDFVSVHVPLIPATTHLINHEKFQMMKSNCVLLNFSRDGIIDEQALLSALNEKKIHAYVTDFPSMQLIHHPQIISLPHLGASTREAEENCAVMIARQLRHFLEHGSIANSVNFPSVDAGVLQADVRLAIVNSNVPSMVAQISTDLAAKGLNIASLVNQSRNEIAYTLIDVNGTVDAVLMKQISEIHGVLQARVILPVTI